VLACHDIFRTTLGIVRLGDIGTRLTDRVQALGMEVLATDPGIHEGALGAQGFGVQHVELDDPLRGLRNVILTPHAAGVTRESRCGGRRCMSRTTSCGCWRGSGR
jgi:phosphoglycerate dehydrogenase-like enzyme